MIINPLSSPNPATLPELRAPVSTPEKRAETVAPAPIAPTPAELDNAVSALNTVLRESKLDLKFSVDNDTQATVVKMVDTSTGELIRQFPSEATLAISRGIEQFQQGLLLRNKA
jgi:flagellar protein FlaG